MQMSRRKAIYGTGSPPDDSNAGAMMSSWIVTDPFIDPSQRPATLGVGGTILAIGSPCLVTRTGSRVRATWSRTARQVVLNFEISICFMSRSQDSPVPPSEQAETSREVA